MNYNDTPITQDSHKGHQTQTGKNDDQFSVRDCDLLRT